jgi:tripartite-type tricarboxylate transporter receptor subunit TctC
MNVPSEPFPASAAAPARRRLLSVAAAGCAAAAFAPALRAQAFPSRPVRVVVPWAPGGLVDGGGRVIGEALGRSLGQPVVVENLPGAAGTVGADRVAKSPPDGHVLLVGTSSLAIDAAAGRRTPYDLARDLVPVATIGDTHSIVVVPAASPFTTLGELLAEARRKPGELPYGTPGIGSPAHLFTELLAQKAGVRLLHVPYNRSPAINDLMGGRLATMVATVPIALGPVRNGLLRPLAVTGPRRLPALPDVPTVAEAGVAGYSAGQWLGLLAPAGTPAQAIERIAAETARAVASPEVAKALDDRGIEPRAVGPADFARLLADDVVTWREVVRAANIRLEG